MNFYTDDQPGLKMSPVSPVGGIMTLYVEVESLLGRRDAEMLAGCSGHHEHRLRHLCGRLAHLWQGEALQLQPVLAAGYVRGSLTPGLVQLRG